MGELQNTLNNYRKLYEDTEQMKIQHAVEKLLKSKKL